LKSEHVFGRVVALPRWSSEPTQAVTGMCQKLAGLEEAMVDFASGFEPALISAAEAEGVMERAARIEHAAATVKALAAARMAETELWEAGGDRSPAHMLAKRTGESVSKAAQQLETAKKLRERPKTDAEARAGRLSPEQTAAIADAAEADPGCEDDLLALAARSSLGELRDEAARRKAAVTDQEENHRKIHDSRHVRSWTGADGAWMLGARGTVDAGAAFMARVQARADVLFKTAYAEGRREPREAYLYDALMDLVCGEAAPVAPKGRGSQAKVIVRVDLQALLRGRPMEGEVCEIAGYGPVPVSVVGEIMARGDTFLAAVITKGKAICGVAHLGRHPTMFQRTALEWLYPTCAVEGCNASVQEWDHRIDWSGSYVTILEWLDGHCCHHHDKKTLEGWGLVEGVGKRAFVPPDDPRHPNNKARERPPPEAAA
jgi:hypothetical protein